MSSRFPLNFAICLSTAAVLAAFGSTAKADWEGTSSFSGSQYAPDPSPGARLDLNVHAFSEDDPNLLLPKREIHFYSFWESGAYGDHSLDIDYSVLRFSTNSNSRDYFWLGRTNPLVEEDPNHSVILPTSAIGANWVQNQSNALSPRVSGWIGAGYQADWAATGTRLNFAFSPIFLPSFGPRLDLSTTNDASGSRFARLPPQYVQIGDALLPLRYQVDTGNIASIIFQPQAFASIAKATSAGKLEVMAWTAPSTDPVIGTNGKLVFDPSQNVNVDVTAIPTFPRREFTGFRWQNGDIFLKPEFQNVYEFSTQTTTFSLQLNPSRYLSFGFLDRIAPPPAPSPDGTPTVESPDYAKELLWLQASYPIEFVHLIPSLRIEQHISPGQVGNWVEPSLTYQASRDWVAFAALNVLAGEDQSYFGTWRSLDSINCGMTYRW